MIHFLDRLEGIKKSTGKRIDDKFRLLKREVLSFFLALEFMIISLIMVTTGVIILLTRWFPIDLVLIVSGILILYVLMLLKLAKR
jgi:hypothetical protein